MAEQNKVILHGMWASTYVKRVELALKFKGIPYEYVEEDLANKSYLLLTHNSVHKKVPVLVHGNPISESLVMLEYIDETWKLGHKLLPIYLNKRAQVRFWFKFIDEQILMATFELFKTEGEERQKALKGVYEKLSVLEKGMKDFFPDGKPCIDSKNVGLLEIAFCSSFGPYKAQEEVLGIKLIDPDKFPVLFSWLTAIVELDVVKELTPPHEKLVELLQSVKSIAA